MITKKIWIMVILVDRRDPKWRIICDQKWKIFKNTASIAFVKSKSKNQAREKFNYEELENFSLSLEKTNKNDYELIT